MHPDADKLFATDQSLREEADRMLAHSGIGAALADAGYELHGSYGLCTMSWRDLDFSRAEVYPDWEQHWNIGTRLGKTGWCVRMNSVNHYREAWYMPGLWWGLRVAAPEVSVPDMRSYPGLWKIDVWSVRPETRERNRGRYDRWKLLMSEEARACILAIKTHDPEYARSITSVDVYEAVLESGVLGLDEFRQWWAERQSRKRD
jgi:hypothetical protein